MASNFIDTRDEVEKLTKKKAALLKAVKKLKTEVGMKVEAIGRFQVLYCFFMEDLTVI